MYQKVILVGNLGADPEINQSQSGTVFGKFSLATSKVYKGESKTSWHNITVFNKTAELCGKYIKKGSKVLIEGEIEYSVYEKDDGTKAYFTSINAFSVKFLDGKNDNSSSSSNEKSISGRNIKDALEQGKTEPLATDDDLPF